MFAWTWVIMAFTPLSSVPKSFVNFIFKMLIYLNEAAAGYTQAHLSFTCDKISISKVLCEHYTIHISINIDISEWKNALIEKSEVMGFRKYSKISSAIQYFSILFPPRLSPIIVSCHIAVLFTLLWLL